MPHPIAAALPTLAASTSRRASPEAGDEPSGGGTESTKHHRILICEDQRDAAETLAMLLRLEGHEVLVCHDGQAAIAQVAKWRPTAALIDIGLPGVTGYGVAQHMRAQEFGADVLLIAVTGYAKPADIEMARYAGFNWHFAKPAHPSFVLEVLQNPDREPMTRRAGTRLRPV